MSNSLQSHGLEPTGLLYPWNSPGKDTGVGCHFLLQGIFPTQGSNPDLLHCRQTLYCLSHQGSFVVKAMVFLVVMYRCESWIIKKAECWRNDTFKLWCWRKLLRVSWPARKSHQLIQKETNPEYSLKGLMLKLKLQHFGHLVWRANSLEKTLMLGKIEGRKRRGRQRVRWLDGITDLMDMSLSKL